MEAYTDFAALYDTFMEDTPYEEWCEYIVGLLKKENINDGLICELGAGTGKFTRLLRDKGYDMIGIDNSEEMLMIARNNELAENDDSTGDLLSSNKDLKEILYLCQDMREFELYGTVGAVVSLCDSMNYLTSIETCYLLSVLKVIKTLQTQDVVVVFMIK